MKIAILGGAGKMALGAIRDLIESNEIDRVFLGDIDKKALEKRRSEIDSKKIISKVVDIDDHKQLVEFLKSCDACLNATIHYFNLKVMKACLEAKTHYTDLGGLFHWARKQMELNESYKKAGITAIVGSGSAPGIVNVMARYGYDQLDTVEYVKIRDGIVSFSPNNLAFSPPYALDTLLDEFSIYPYAFKNGEFIEKEPFSGMEDIEFPEPIGKQIVFNTIHTEVATIPISFRNKGIKEVSFKLSLPKELEKQLRLLVELGLGSTKAVKINNIEVVPRHLLIHLVTQYLKKTPNAAQNRRGDDHKVLRVEVKGTKNGKKVEYILESIMHPYEEWDMPMGIFTVGFPAAVTTRMLAKRQIGQYGVFPSEQAIDPQNYFSELAKRGIQVNVFIKQQL